MQVTVRGGPEGSVTLGVEAGSGRHEVVFRVPAEVAGAPVDVEQAAADAAVALCLLPAMQASEDLAVAGPVSPRLLTGAAQVADVFCAWDHALHPTDRYYQPIAVRGDRVVEAGTPPGRGTAAFFTGGVDSFHTAVEHRDELDALVYVHGFDVALADTALRSEVAGRLRESAAALGLPLIEVETDLRTSGLVAAVPWPDHHGAALAAVAHLLASRFDRVLVPATHTYARLEGLGSHPLLDPLWSSEAVRIEHVGAGATRVAKLRRIVEEPAATAHLRVCWENPGGAYNCGRCEKCVRTGVAVRIAGVEGRFPSIPQPSLRTVAGALPTGRGSNWHDLRADLLAADGSPRLRAAIDVALARHQVARWRASPLWSR